MISTICYASVISARYEGAAQSTLPGLGKNCGLASIGPVAAEKMDFARKRTEKTSQN